MVFVSDIPLCRIDGYLIQTPLIVATIVGIVGTELVIFTMITSILKEKDFTFK